MRSEEVPHTGKGGRVTKQDVLGVQEQSAGSSGVDRGERLERRQAMSRLRKTIATRLRDVQHEAALLTTFNEIDMTEVLRLRRKYKESFYEAYEVNLGFMSFFTRAVCVALMEYPVINAFLEKDEIVYHDYCDIGIAVSTEKGLVVPIVRDAHRMGFEAIERQIRHFAQRGKEGDLTLEEMTGGTFTITNGGVFGSMLSTPIVNRPQSAILGMHRIVERPVVKEGTVQVAPVMYVALTYDHRLIDGEAAARFLVSVKERLEDPVRLLIGI